MLYASPGSWATVVADTPSEEYSDRSLVVTRYSPTSQLRQLRFAENALFSSFAPAGVGATGVASTVHKWYIHLVPYPAGYPHDCSIPRMQTDVAIIYSRRSRIEQKISWLESSTRRFAGISSSHPAVSHARPKPLRSHRNDGASVGSGP